MQDLPTTGCLSCPTDEVLYYNNTVETTKKDNNLDEFVCITDPGNNNLSAVTSIADCAKYGMLDGELICTECNADRTITQEHTCTNSDLNVHPDLPFCKKTSKVDSYVCLECIDNTN